MNEPLYPIRAVSKQTGISIDTLRAWERRYQVVTPGRDDRGRLFSEGDIKRLRLLKQAVDQGHAIGQLAEKSDNELQALLSHATAIVEKTPDPVTRPGASVDMTQLIAGIERLDYAAVEKELGIHAAVMPPRELIHQIVLPLLQFVGESWHAGKMSIAHEHMTSAILRNLLGALVPLHRRQDPPAKIMFATPSKEQHEFGILLSAMLTAGGGLGIVYLGPNLPADEIVFAAQKTAPQAVVLGLVGANGAKAAVGEVDIVSRKLPSQIELWVGGTKDEEVVREVRATRALFIDGFDMLEKHLVRLGARF